MATSLSNEIAEAVRGMRAGSVLLQIQEGRVVGVESRETNGFCGEHPPTRRCSAAFIAPDVSWTLLRSPAWQQIGDDGFVPDFPDAHRLLVSLPLWLGRRQELLERSDPVGLLLTGDDDLARLGPELSNFPLIAVALASRQPHAPVAQLLREQYRYGGTLVALDAAAGHGAALRAEGFDAAAVRSAADMPLDDTITLRLLSETSHGFGA